ncbi:hypothetical protein Poli38472_003222 [Pythium oligandrum]|uniref:Trafficking protein particle complex subunit 11 domain-containing protein n=1 Tax=Pythium oligandrum TaxID=41045 RepID=A0A8K1C775_PYTOL|nr:hypothetical protein Poli38472_003222 [Pythium oligandrum]|eukprot:TMW57297.1 hypothetical protein Poli38472_003222 [Pythium oligandrum]
MESYGSELKETPYPLIAALGARELQAKVLPHVRTINEEFVPKLHFTSLPIEHRFPVKKEVREKHGTFPNQTQRDFEGYRVQGILKARWLKKHHELVPAVVLLFHEFDPRWSLKDWSTQESTMKEEMDQLKRGLSGRECRVVLLLLQQVEDGGATPANVTDERLASLRRRLETDSKAILLLRSRDLTRGSPVLTKLESSVRNYALEYYKAQSKRVKRYKKALNKTTHLPLHVRHSFKIAHYYEFRRYTTKVLQHYEAAYRAVMALPLNDAEIGFFQVKTMAELINFKLCYHLIFSSNNIKAAVDQLHRHMRVYGRAMGPVERSFEHWEWVSRQYHVFAQLLSEAVSIRGTLPSTGLDSDAYKEPYLYYSIAAKYATYRRKAAAKLGLVDPAASDVSAVPSTDMQGDFVVVPSIFLGADPVVSEATMPEPSYGAFVKYRYSMERTVPHARKTIHLLEQAMQHLSLCVADQKVPRNRLKNRLLLQLGMERLATNDLERARAELQKAKLAFGTENWWSQSTQILKQLLICTFRQGDKAAYIDFSLQLLSPILAEYLSVPERLRIQESFELAWKEPARLGEPFTGETLPGHSIPLDHSRPLFDVHAHFDRVYACVREEINLHLQVECHFAGPIQMHQLELLFSDDRYNITVRHRDGVDGIVHDASDGHWYASLVFDPVAHKSFRLSFPVREGREILRYHETHFHFSRATAEPGNSLVFVLPFDGKTVRRSPNPKPYLIEGRVPVMGKGPGSPSFARRKSMFSVAERGRSQESETGDLIEEDGSPETRSTALAILQPRAKAQLTLVTKHALLTGDYRVISFLLKAKEDTLKNPTFRVTSEPASASNAANDAVFFMEAEGTQGSLVPVPLDANFQPLERTAMREMEPHSETSFSVIVRSLRGMPLRLAVHVTYATKSGVQVSLEERYELQCQDPFRLSSGFVHDFPNGGADPNLKESHAIVGKSVNLHGNLHCEAIEPVRILSLTYEPTDDTTVTTHGVIAAGFGTFNTEDESQVLKEFDRQSFYLRLLPSQAAPFVALGRVKLQWRRLSSVVPTNQDHCNDVVTTWLEIPSVAFVDAPLTIKLETPSFGVESTLLTMELRVRNNEGVIHSVRIKPIDENGDFLIAGRTNIVEDLLPQEDHLFRIGLIPTKAGYLRLPQLEITSVTYNMPFANSNERRELFVFPRESPVWKSPAESSNDAPVPAFP